MALFKTSDNDILFHVSDISENSNELDHRLENAILTGSFITLLEKYNILASIELLPYMNLQNFFFSKRVSDDFKVFWDVRNDEIDIGVIAYTTSGFELQIGSNRCNSDLIKCDGSNLKWYN